MPKEKANRKRSVQIKFRLTPEESAVLEQDIKKSKLSKNDYFIKTMINRIGLSAITCERKLYDNSIEVHFMLSNKRIGYANCLFFKNIKKVQISSFYVLKQFQDIGIEEQLLQEIVLFAETHQAESIIAYPGAEPFCPTEWKPIDVQTTWYQKNGFDVDHMIYGYTPCMMMKL